MINNYGVVPRDQVILDRDRFRPDWRKGQVLTKQCTTSYSPIYDKGTTVFPHPQLLVA